MSKYVAAYDVSDDRQRDKVARILDRLGERIQRSVYVLWLESKEISELRREIGILLSEDDRFDMFPVDERGTRTRLSWQQHLDVDTPVIVIDGER